MHIVTATATFDAPADAVWAIVGDYGGLKAWSRAVQQCELEGSGVGGHRVLTTAAGRIRERLDAWDPAARRLVYTPVSGSSLPVRDLQASITVTPTGPAGSRVDWRIEGEPLGPTAEVAAQLRARYQARLEELRDVLARATR